MKNQFLLLTPFSPYDSIILIYSKFLFLDRGALLISKDILIWAVVSQMSTKVKAPKAEIHHYVLTWSFRKQRLDCHRSVNAQPPVESYT